MMTAMAKAPRSRLVAVSTLASALLGSLAAPTGARAEGLPAHASWSTLSFSNGFGAGAYDTQRRRLVSLREHLYAARNENTRTRELMYDTYLGLRVGGANVWLTDRPVVEAGYDEGRGIATVVQTFGDARVTQHVLMPMDVDAAAMVVVVEVTNTGDAALSDAALFSLHNLHVGGGGGGTDGERIQWQGGAYEERGEAGLVLVRGAPTPDAHACSPSNPYVTVSGGGRLSDVADSGTMNDAVSGLEWDLTGLAAGATRTFALTLAHRADGDRAALDASLAVLDDDPATLLADARAEWDAYLGAALTPPGLSADEASVYRQQLSVLRMGQVREPGGGFGQVVASLPPGMWNITWVRDQAYALFGMIRAGLYQQARDALAFWWNADAGDWVCCDDQGGPWVGQPYALSVVRYHGDGTEETDFNERGPNVEFDGFGLALMAMADYVEATDEDALLTEHAGDVFELTADVLVSLIESDGAAAGLLRADSSIWETHWYDGGKRHFTYTQATAVAGLRAAARLADRAGRRDDAGRYRDAADALAAAVASKLVDPATDILRSSLEETSSYLDGAAIEAFNWGVLPRDHAALPATLDAFRAGLWNDVVGRGYRRNDDGGEYDRREWIVIDLRIARAARLAGRHDHADALVAWVTEQARLNFDVVPENFHRITGDYEGEVPMLGFGAGAYVTALWEREVGPDPGTPDAAPGGDGGQPSTDGGGGGCCDARGGAGSSAINAVLLALVVALPRRRRRA
jgi:GH15 family glucan-1,4-alpha-glucosidase